MKIPKFRMAALCLLFIDSTSAEPSVQVPRILDDISNEMPVGPGLPNPGLIISEGDVMSSRIIRQGEREITVQEIKPIVLPEPTVVPSPPDRDAPVIQARSAQPRVNQPKYEICSVGATVYRWESTACRSLFTYQSRHAGLPLISFWSSMDASLLQGISQYEGTDGIIRNLIMVWSVRDMDSISSRSSSRRKADPQPAIPDFPSGPATYIILTGTPGPEDLATIQSLHDIYNQSKAQVLAAAAARENARIAREAELEANPSKPENIVLNYWNIHKNSTMKGGSK